MATDVVDPSGRRWRVARVWFTRGAKWRGNARAALDASDGLSAADLFSDVPGIGVAVVLVVVGAMVAFITAVLVLPAVLVILEILFIVIVAGVSLLARVLLRRPWLIRARRLDGDGEVVRKVVGFRASGEAVRALAERIRHGQPTLTWGPEPPD